MRKGYKVILTAVRRGLLNGLYVDTEFLNGLQVDMDTDIVEIWMWIWVWIWL